MMSDRMNFEKRISVADRLDFDKRVSFKDDKEMMPEPMLNDWQLIGDSQFLRFSERFLGKTRKKKDGFAYIGLCVSGQRTADLLERMTSKFGPIGEKVILMIGTNDLLKGTNETVLRVDIKKVVMYLHNDLKVRDIIILTIPPVPRLAKSPDHWKILKSYNACIKSFKDGGTGIRVIDTYSSFIKNDESPSWNFVSLSRDLSSVHNSPSPSTRNSPPPSSRSSLVSQSSDYTNRLLWCCSSNSITKPPYTSNFEKIRTNLRIEAGDKPRTIYVLDSDEEKAQREAEEDSEDSGDDGYTSIKSTPVLKRTSHYSRLPTPDPKRLSLGSGSYVSIAQDDHNDRFYTKGDSEPVPGEDKIEFDYFERFFDTNCTRTDLIHLNTKGLLVIQKLIRNEICK